MERVVCPNCRNYIRKHTFCIEVFFLILYVYVEIMLMVLIIVFPNFTQAIVGIFIILLLFILALDKIIMKVKKREEDKYRDSKINSLTAIYQTLKRLLYISERLRKKK
ncbi:hypothetical protein ES703_110168 [subsurface metagenome]